MPTSFGQTRSTSKRGVYRMVFRARDEQVARTALSVGHRLLMAAINDQAFAVPVAVAQVRAQVDDCYLGPSTACIVAAATDRSIPHIRLNDGNLVQLGYGASQRRIWTAETELTSAIAEGIAHDKDLTKSLLASCGVPVPEGSVADSPEAAWEAAQDIGLPVVVKPSDANHGRGVSLDLNTREDIEKAWKDFNGGGTIPYLGVGAHSDWADANPDKVQKLYTIYKAAVEWVQKNPDEAAPLLAKGAPPEELKAVAAMIKSNERLAMKLTKAGEIKKDIQAVYKAGMEINYLPSMPSDGSIYDKPLK